jgi:hypothetical protein
MHKLVLSTLLIISFTHLFGQFFDPLKYGVNDSIPFISLTESEKKENELALFEITISGLEVYPIQIM